MTLEEAMERVRVDLAVPVSLMGGETYVINTAAVRLILAEVERLKGEVEHANSAAMLASQASIEACNAMDAAEARAADLLAQHIQEAIETWLNTRR